MDNKFEKLLSVIKDMQSAVLAFSGGVDSTFLLKAIKESKISALAVTGYSETMPKKELLFAIEMARFINVKHRVINTDEMSNPLFIKNPKDRCFYCKDELFSKLLDIANTEGYKHIVDGSNADDISDWRPGMKAALKYKVRSPLIEAGFSKNEIREVSKELGLPTWAKPSSPCLSSRFPYGVEITRDALRRVELSEEFLKNHGFSELRVRSHNDMAKIELKVDEIDRLFDKELRESITNKFKAIGFKYITIDLEGFRSGKLN